MLLVARFYGSHGECIELANGIELANAAKWKDNVLDIFELFD